MARRRVLTLLFWSFAVALWGADMPKVLLHTDKGDILLRIRTDWAPRAAENFLTHVKNGYYDGVIFHRVIRGFMIQSGDPTGTGRGGDSIWHKPFANEYAKNVVFDRPGVLAMANTGRPVSNRSQFFITVAPAPWLNGGYTIFGEVIEGMETVRAVSRVAVDRRHRPIEPVRIRRAEIAK